MRKLVVAAYLTADGVMQAPGGPQEDRDGGFAYGGWTVPYWDEELSRLVAQAIQRAGALMLGRRTYEIFWSRWPGLIDEPVATMPWGERLFYARDPFGSRISFVDERTLFTG